MLGALVSLEIILFSALIFVCEKGAPHTPCPKTRAECEALGKVRMSNGALQQALCEWTDRGGTMACTGKFVRSDGKLTPFTSIPQTMWWCMQTITTVGYGDLAPIENWGQVFGFITMIT